MMQNEARKVTRTWALLVLLTVPSMAAAYEGVGGFTISTIALAMAVAKGRWMLMDFLKLRHAPSGWRNLLSSWLVLVASSAWIAAAASMLRS
jgi:hypothetical protein